MNVDSIREFIIFSDYMNFSRAARKLHISQPAMSNHVASMEKELGVKLVDRGDMRITSEGRLFLAHAQDVIDSYDKAVSSLRLGKDGVVGKVVVKQPFSSGTSGSMFTKIMCAVKHEYPLIDVSMTGGTHEYILDEIAKSSIACGLYFNFRPEFAAYDGSRFESIPIAKDSCYLFVHKRHPLATKDPLLVRDLADYPLLMPKGASFHDLVVAAVQIASDHGTSFKFDYRVAESVCNLFLSEVDEHTACLVGSEASRVLEITVHDDMIIRPFDEDVSVVGSIVYSAKNGSPAFGLFIDYVRENFALEVTG
ncbi:MAG: LysR family transcriptional regulator [Coriobacteriia bacterium]|nr:LysR family transcriptional regulator [Coriobacteriia bacterium]